MIADYKLQTLNPIQLILLAFFIYMKNKLEKTYFWTAFLSGSSL